MKVELLRKIQKHILAEPKRFVMWTWIIKKGSGVSGDLGETYEADGLNEVEYPKCGTAACIAGWACILNDDKRVRDFGSRGQKVLGLTLTQRTNLFTVDAWPDNFCDEFDRAQTPSERAQVAVARIDHFIATNGAE